MYPQTILFNDSNNDLMNIVITEKEINFCLVFNAGEASIFTYVKDNMNNEYENRMDAIEAYEKEINGVEY